MTALRRGFLVAGILVLSLARAHAAEWIQVSPPALTAGVSVYDPVRDRFVMTAGWDGGHHRSDTWVTPADRSAPWSRLATIGTPPRQGGTAVSDTFFAPVALSGAVYDPVRDRMLVFGDRNASGALETTVWALALSGTPAWSVLATTGTPPGPRHACALAYDPDGDRLIVYGGYGPHPTLGDVTWNEVWALTLSGTPAWSLLTPAGTPPQRRQGAAFAFDAASHRLIVFGGSQLDDTWALQLGPQPLAWSEIPSTNRPSGRSFATALLDPVSATLRIVGGNTGQQPDMWSLPLAGGAWTRVAFEVPVGNGGQLFADPVRHVFALQGGLRANTPRPLDDTWIHDPAGAPGNWALAQGALRGSGPRGRALVFQDVLHDRMLLFGGIAPVTTGPTPPISFALAGRGPWAPYAPSGDSSVDPVALDPLRKQLLATDGFNPTLHVLDLATNAWSAVATTNAPSMTIVAAAVDSVNDRLLVFGNGTEQEFGTPITAAWALPLGVPGPTWTRVAQVVAAPPANSGEIAIYDGPGARILWFGVGASAWALHLTGTPAWEHLPNLPIPMTGPSAALDPAHRTLYVFYANQQYVGEVFLYAWDLAQPGTQMTRLFPGGPSWPIRGRYYKVGFDTARGELYVFGGPDGTWVVPPASAPPVGVDRPAGHVALSLRAFPVPSAQGVRLSWTTKAAGHASLVIVDLAGRVVRALVSDDVPAGEHAAAWDGRDAHGARVPAGVYFASLQAGDRRVSRRLVLVTP